ncbi:MAG: bifunctional demethylmenaquinone methyltransferase/2-methoxy-6-polyprenyl-1,4-benzoquinol methylase UbiE [Muribaculaceae bacterium]|nr:bifunctional demethylmenaquinone methyltransferase/2-methoxy-6-polyprenyl-1,4-benzoquinol methylase UbiE [Muribaculaceae bacterium]
MEVKAEHIKPYDADRAKTEQVREMFDSIAPAYDWMNRAMTFGVDKSWRRKAVAMVAATSPGHIIDIATGTGDLAIALARKITQATVTGIDLSQGMVDIGKKKIAEAGLSDRVDLLTADCLAMPFGDDSADAITVAYGVRNFEHLDLGYAEMFRVLKPGGLLCVVELSTPVNPMVKPFYKLYTKLIIPTLGRMVSKDSRAYSYLPESIAAVPQGDDMLRLISDAGFTDTAFRRLTFGVCTIYTGHKPR